MPAKIKDADFSAHFWSRTRKQGRCIEWIGSRWDGYGTLGFEGGTTRAHRVAWILYFGRIPKGKCVLHKCDNRACVKPAHLFLGTRLDNNRDREKKGRGVYARGEQCSWSKLNWKKVVRIRRAYATGFFTMKELAEECKVDVKAIFRVIHNMTWRKKR